MYSWRDTHTHTHACVHPQAQVHIVNIDGTPHGSGDIRLTSVGLHSDALQHQNHFKWIQLALMNRVTFDLSHTSIVPTTGSESRYMSIGAW